MGVRILIVEDEQIVAADLESKLGRIGHQVVGTAASGEEAISVAEEIRPELVLMDIRLQGRMNGAEAASRIQRLTGAPIVFITAYAEIFMRDPTLMNPPGLCLSKPFSISQLKAVLDAAVQQRH